MYTQKYSSLCVCFRNVFRRLDGQRPSSCGPKMLQLRIIVPFSIIPVWQFYLPLPLYLCPIACFYGSCQVPGLPRSFMAVCRLRPYSYPPSGPELYPSCMLSSVSVGCFSYTQDGLARACCARHSGKALTAAQPSCPRLLICCWCFQVPAGCSHQFPARHISSEVLYGIGTFLRCRLMPRLKRASSGLVLERCIGLKC